MKRLLIFKSNNVSDIKNAIVKENRILYDAGLIDNNKIILMPDDMKIKSNKLYLVTDKNINNLVMDNINNEILKSHSYLIFSITDINLLKSLKNTQIFEFNGIDENDTVNSIIKKLPLNITDSALNKLKTYLSKVKVDDEFGLIETIVLKHYEDTDDEIITNNDIPDIPTEHISIKLENSQNKSANKEEEAIIDNQDTQEENANQSAEIHKEVKPDTTVPIRNESIVEDEAANTNSIVQDYIELDETTTDIEIKNEDNVDITNHKTCVIKPDDADKVLNTIKDTYLKTIYFIRKQNDSKWDKMLKAFEDAVNSNYFNVSGCKLYMEQSDDYGSELYHILYEAEVETGKYKLITANVPRKFKHIGCFKCNYEWDFDETEKKVGEIYQVTCPACKNILNLCRTE